MENRGLPALGMNKFNAAQWKHINDLGLVLTAIDRIEEVIAEHEG